jgi:D-glycero-alpha-D-manno-heptose-7-phosphate kinase
MSFFGGGTDMPEYFLQHKGAVLSTTFDKYCYVNVRHLPRFFDYSNEFCYSVIERVSSPDEIKHPAIRNAVKMLKMQEIRLSYEADLPARSGLGTSSSFAVGMLEAFHALKGHYRSKKTLAEEAIHLERDLCGEAGGWQDQIAASFGGLNRINFEGDRFEVLPIIIDPSRKKELNSNLVLLFTGFTRFSSEIQKENKAQSSLEIENKNAVLGKMYEIVDEAEKILEDNDRSLDDFGRLLDVTWNLKKESGKAVTNSNIDFLYDKGKKAGALGGKLLGAGGGGFLLFYVPKERRRDVVDAFGDLLNVPFRFEDSGTRIIYYEAEDFKGKE